MGSVKNDREPNTIYTLSLSYGKDSLACLGAIEHLGLPLDRIIHAEVWATQDIPADLPPMVEFKAKADKIIKERYGIEVEHVCAINKNGGGCLPTQDCLDEQSKTKSMESTFTDSQSNKVLGVQENLNKTFLPKLTYEDIFYRTLKHRGGGCTGLTGSRCEQGNGATSFSKSMPSITGFATKWSQYCTGEIKRGAIENIRVPNLRQQRELVYKPQNESFPKARVRRAV